MAAIDKVKVVVLGDSGNYFVCINLNKIRKCKYNKQEI